MDALKVQFERIMKQLGGLTASQKMLVASLVAVMVMTLLYWGRYAGSPEMVPVLGQALSEDEIGRIDAALEARGIPHTVAAGKILVPADRKTEVVADLMFTHSLPRDTKSAFEDMTSKLNMFASESERDAYYNQATQMELAQIIRRFPGVDDAKVIINPKSERRIEESVQPSATVFITTRDGTATKQLVSAAADGVAGAVSGMNRSKISVIVNGASFHATDADSDPLANGGELRDARRRSESQFEQKIRDRFSYIQGLTVTVSCDIENRTILDNKVTYDPDHTLVKESKVHEHTEETNNAAPVAADPGAGANTAASIATSSAGGGNSTSTITDNQTDNQIFAAQSVQKISTPAGKDSVQSVTVGVPRSYFAMVYKQRNNKDADDAALQTFATAELASMKTSVKNCVNLKSEESMSVDMYADTLPVMAMASAAAVVAPAGGISTVTGHAKEIAVAVLAIVSLFMMSSMVKKATPAPVIAAAHVDEGPGILSAGEMLAGEAGESDQSLDAMELDNETVREQQVVDQVTTMVKENPDGAAAMVKRWLNRT